MPPRLPQQVSWLPIDLAAQAMVDILHHRTDASPASSASIEALTHPFPTPWQAIVTVLADELESTVIPYSEWFNRIEESLGTPDFEDLSAKRLLPFFRGLHSSGNREYEGRDAFGSAQMLVSPATRSSLANALPLTEREVQSWVTYWRGVKFVIVR